MGLRWLGWPSGGMQMTPALKLWQRMETQSFLRVHGQILAGGFGVPSVQGLATGFLRRRPDN